MTLTEYLNQVDPVYMPKVELRPDEYRVISKVFNGQEWLGWIQIHEFPQYQYISRGASCRLYASDDQGNPTRPTCFYLPFDPANN